MIVVPLQAVASQQINVNLGGQPCAISVYQKSTGLFLDLSVNGSPIVTGRICQNQNLLVRDAYLGFVGDLAFGDVIGTSDPDYTGIGVRFYLFYISPGDL